MIDFTEISIDIISEQLIKARKENNLTQGQVGATLGLGKSEVSRYERNTGSISFANVLKYVNAIGSALHLEQTKGKLDGIDEIIEKYKAKEISSNEAIKLISKRI